MILRARIQSLHLLLGLIKANAPTSSKGDAVSSRTCELCRGTYSDLDSHLVSKRHTAAANDDSLFEGVDHLIRRGTSFEN